TRASCTRPALCFSESLLSSLSRSSFTLTAIPCSNSSQGVSVRCGGRRLNIELSEKIVDHFGGTLENHVFAAARIDGLSALDYRWHFYFLKFRQVMRVSAILFQAPAANLPGEFLGQRLRVLAHFAFHFSIAQNFRYSICPAIDILKSNRFAAAGPLDCLGQLI